MRHFSASDVDSHVTLREPLGSRMNALVRAWLLVVCGLLGTCTMLTRASDAAELPAGFSETKVAEGLNPTTMAFAPDGRLFLCEKQGRILIIEDGKVLETPLIDFSEQVDGWNERGLGGLCFDPEFSSNGYIYLYYTAKAPSHNRVSRFTVVGNTAAKASEQVIFEIDNLSKIGWHNGGGICFGKDGKLYIATGENANGDNAQNPSNLLGKLLRINRDGSIPSDNPNNGKFRDRNQAIVALGFRNPFAMTAHPENGTIFICNVGAKYEEIERYDSDVTPQHVNYGWPNLDGPRGGQYGPEGYRDPAYAYDHGSGQGTALCGGDFYVVDGDTPPAFPAEYHGAYFFSDYGGWIKYIDPFLPEVRHDFATKIARPIDVEIAPDGSLWYLARAGKGGGSDEDNTATTNGSLWRVEWTGRGAATQLKFLSQRASANVGGLIGPAVQVAVQNAKGETITSSKAWVTLKIKGHEAKEAAIAAKLSGTIVRQAIDGVATFDDLRIDRSIGELAIECSSEGLASASSEVFEVAAKVDLPSITPRSSTYSGPVHVQIECATEDAVIHFTTDGTMPTTASPVYREPFLLTNSSMVHAIATRSDLADSDRANALLTISDEKAYGMDFRPEVTGVSMPPANGPEIPTTLTATGLFSDVASLNVAAGVVPYDVNSPLWSDGADKTRWVALPARGRIKFADQGEYQWPGGTMFIKHFELVVNESTKQKRRLETRVLVVDETGYGYGVTYKWRGDNADADLLTEGLDEEIEIVGKDGQTRQQTWHYPSQQECLQCHTVKSGFVLGPSTRQLNLEHRYPSGRVDNQLRTWNYLQMFQSDIDEDRVAGFEKLVRVDDPSASLEHRVRSYFDANCAFCHRPGGTGAQWDARYLTELADQHNINGAVRETFGIPGAKIVSPGDLKQSIMHLRLTSSQLTQRMPPVGRNVVDVKAVDAISEWIETLEPAAANGIVSGKVYYLTAKHSNKRLGISGDQLGADGATARQSSPAASKEKQDANQRWQLDEMGNGWWRLTNVASGKVLDVPSGSKSNSTALQQYRDNGGDNQRWALTRTNDGYFVITSKVSGKNVDVDGVSRADGAEIHQYQHTGNDNQRWSITPVDQE
ncbi:PQQ-dependent sugar dehydrogenase [Rhodopirellula sp. MGV]|uniref:PQQ-dependent sugar dehydrogenase n=1 Tax=Rhodopirellula sp. MGV TaxID=2023130 RepID=UPI0013040FAB|nr:PQQ-dependent sugar dehydrogenase [Rhodopirellula sp. MGV]